MIKIKVLTGASVKDNIRKMVETAKTKKQAVVTEINGVGLVANPGDKVHQIGKYYDVRFGRQFKKS
jgi:hypothetical protein